jgi:hypothetical protein
VKKHGGKNWVAIAALVPGRTKLQCKSRWRNALNSIMNRVTGRKGKWEEDEDIKLKDAVQKLGSSNWAATTALVPSRTHIQCRSRWHDALDPNNDRVNGCTATWKDDEDIKLMDAVQKHSGKNWVALAAPVSGRTKIQCRNRWCSALEPSIDRTTGRTGNWEEDEDAKLKAAVQTYGGKSWVAIAALVPGRTKLQCKNRWRAFDSSIDRLGGRTGEWKEEDDITLASAVE